jgi:hypothetical protein
VQEHDHNRDQPRAVLRVLAANLLVAIGVPFIAIGAGFLFLAEKAAGKQKSWLDKEF